MNAEVPDSLPDYVTFNDAAASFQMFKYLEAFPDGMGAWRFWPEDKHPLEQSEPMMEDLLQWKWLQAIMDKDERKRKKQEEEGTHGLWE